MADANDNTKTKNRIVEQSSSAVIAKVASRDVTDCRTLIVIPCYNEEYRLFPDIFIDYIKSHPQTGFVFVDDGSKDNTFSVLMKMRVQSPSNIEVVRLSKNSGKAEAVRVGMTYAVSKSAEYVGYWDADLATPLEAIDDFLAVMNRYDAVALVYGARKRLVGRRIYRTLKRRIISRICALLARFAILMPVTDTQCGAKLLRNNPATRTALSQPFKTDWLFDVELFARLAQLMPQPLTSFYEYPLSEWEEVAGSKITGTTVLRAGFSILKLIARIHFIDKKMEVINTIPPLPASAYVIPSMAIGTTASQGFGAQGLSPNTASAQKPAADTQTSETTAA